jgi:hypothetical protein
VAEKPLELKPFAVNFLHNSGQNSPLDDDSPVAEYRPSPSAFLASAIFSIHRSRAPNLRTQIVRSDCCYFLRRKSCWDRRTVWSKAKVNNSSAVLAAPNSNNRRPASITPAPSAAGLRPGALWDTRSAIRAWIASGCEDSNETDTALPTVLYAAHTQVMPQ